jgi:hypothetical protein
MLPNAELNRAVPGSPSAVWEKMTRVLVAMGRHEHMTSPLAKGTMRAFVARRMFDIPKTAAETAPNANT